MQQPTEQQIKDSQKYQDDLLLKALRKTKLIRSEKGFALDNRETIKILKHIHELLTNTAAVAAFKFAEENIEHIMNLPPQKLQLEIRGVLLALKLQKAQLNDNILVVMKLLEQS
jgi:H2-forming N5,N10-methylenetetrahydromethanopterin dehydrogenase-like enzyme